MGYLFSQCEKAWEYVGQKFYDKKAVWDWTRLLKSWQRQGGRRRWWRGRQPYKWLPLFFSYQFPVPSSYCQLLLLLAMAACLSPAIPRQPIHRRCCCTPKLPSSSTATFYGRPHRRITGTSSTAISARASAAPVAQGLNADDIRHPLDKQVNSWFQFLLFLSCVVWFGILLI